MQAKLRKATSAVVRVTVTGEDEPRYYRRSNSPSGWGFVCARDEATVLHRVEAVALADYLQSSNGPTGRVFVQDA